MMMNRTNRTAAGVILLALATAAPPASSQVHELGDLGKADLYPSERGVRKPAPETEPFGRLSARDAIAFLMAQDTLKQDTTVANPVGTVQVPKADSGGVARLTVRGSAELQKPADQLRLRIAVTTEGPEAESAMNENSRKANDVIAALRKAGLTEKEYETGHYQIHPVYSHRPPRGQMEADWKARIVGYRVMNSLNIKTTKIDLAGALIEAATQAGADTIDSIWFDLADPRKHRAHAIREATANAKSDADALAGASEQRLVRIISISLDDAQAPPIPMHDMVMARGALAALAAPSTPIQPGEVTIHAAVTLVYEIAPQS